MPSRRFYMVMLSIAGASALFAFGIIFGVGVVTAPPERKMEATAEQFSTADGVRREPVQIGANKALTPIYPANPGKESQPPDGIESARVETVGSGADVATQEDAATEIAVTEPAAPAVVEQLQPAPPAEVDVSTVTAGVPPAAAAPTPLVTKEVMSSVPAPEKVNPPAPAAPDTETVTAKPDLETVTLRKPGRCDVAACSAAYRSFRASDCTFQPYEGPRQLCENPPAARSTPTEEEPQRAATRESKPARERDKDAELRAAVEAVKELTGPPLAERRLVPFAERGRGRARMACNVAACAQAYDSFDPSDCTFQPHNGPRQLCAR
jgi:hypothetical protein